MLVDRKILKPIPNADDQTCFACGEKNEHGLQMQFFTDEQQLYSFLEVPGAMAGWDTTVHGGILSTMLDEIMAWSVIYLFKKLVVTKTITVDFIKPVQVGSRITVIGGVVQPPTGRSVQMKGEIYNEEELLCASGTAEFSVLEPKMAMRIGLLSKEYMQMFEPILQA